MNIKTEIKESIFKGIINDLNNRKGFDFNDIDEETIDDIKHSWYVIIDDIFDSAAGEYEIEPYTGY